MTAAALIALLALVTWSERDAIQHVIDLVRGNGNGSLASETGADVRPLARHFFRTWLPLGVLSLGLAFEGLRRLLSKT